MKKKKDIGFATANKLFSNEIILKNQNTAQGEFMRKVIWLMNVSLEGFVGGSNGEIDWIYFDEVFLSVMKAAHSFP